MPTSEELVVMLTAMEGLETAISAFYAACAGRWPEHGKLWNALAQAELRHADYLRKMTEFVKNNPAAYTPGRTFLPKAIETVTRGVTENTARVAGRGLEMKNALFIARDFEQSIIEKNYHDLIRTRDAQFNSMIAEIVKETGDHNLWLQNKIKEISL